MRQPRSWSLYLHAARRPDHEACSTRATSPIRSSPGNRPANPVNPLRCPSQTNPPCLKRLAGDQTIPPRDCYAPVLMAHGGIRYPPIWSLGG